jgi:WD40 repeat protein
MEHGECTVVCTQRSSNNSSLFELQITAVEWVLESDGVSVAVGTADGCVALYRIPSDAVQHSGDPTPPVCVMVCTFVPSRSAGR